MSTPETTAEAAELLDAIKLEALADAREAQRWAGARFSTGGDA